VLSAALVAPTGVVRLTLKGAPARHWQILRDRDVWTEQVHVLAQTCGDLWIDKLIFDLAPEAAQDTSGASDELAAIMATICGEPGFQEHARQYVETVLQDLPATLRERLIADEATRDALVARLTQAGADRVLAQMKGAES
jgi:hypothetical protein